MTGGRWIGGAAVPMSRLGMFNTPKGLARLSVSREQISLTVHPAFLAERLASHPWVVRPADPAAIFAVRGSGFARGVGFQVAQSRPFYFWAGRHRDEVVAAITAAGYPVEAVERRPQYH